jgi:hypothetical protein
LPADLSASPSLGPCTGGFLLLRSALRAIRGQIGF